MTHVKQNSVQLYIQNPSGRFVPVVATETGEIVSSSGGSFDALENLQTGPYCIEYTWNQTWTSYQKTSLKFKILPTGELGHCVFNFIVDNHGLNQIDPYLQLFFNDDCSGTSFVYSGWNPYRNFGFFSSPKNQEGSGGWTYGDASVGSYLQAQHFRSAELWTSISGSSPGDRTIYIISSVNMEILL